MTMAGTSNYIENTNSNGTFTLRTTGSNGVLALNAEGTNNSAITMSIAGYERVRLTPYGNLGVGTTSPYGALSVTSQGYTTGVGFVVADAGNNPHFIVQDSGAITATGAITSSATSASTFPFASTTVITASGTASTTNLIVSSAGGTAGCATFDTIGTLTNTHTACGVSSGGSGYPFPVIGNATSTLTQFNGGLTAYSTSTIATARSKAASLSRAARRRRGMRILEVLWVLVPHHQYWAAISNQKSLSREITPAPISTTTVSK